MTRFRTLFYSTAKYSETTKNKLLNKSELNGRLVKPLFNYFPLSMNCFEISVQIRETFTVSV